MKKTIALLLTMVLMMCSLGTVVFATSAPVITDAYIGGFPVVGYALHVVVDGTYNGVAFKPAEVTATYQWEYADSLDSDTWTAATANQYINRACDIKSNMVGKYVRCTITPIAGGVSGTPVTVVFPTKVMANSAEIWDSKTVKTITFDSAADLDQITKYTECQTTYDAERKAMKIAGWPLTSGVIKTNQVGFSVPNVVVKSDTVTVVSYSHSVDQGQIQDMQTGVESGAYGATAGNIMSDPIRGGFYSLFTAKPSSATTSTAINTYEVALKSANSNKALAKPESIITSNELMKENVAWSYWTHPHMQASAGGATVTGDTTAILQLYKKPFPILLPSRKMAKR